MFRSTSVRARAPPRKSTATADGKRTAAAGTATKTTDAGAAAPPKPVAAATAAAAATTTKSSNARVSKKVEKPVRRNAVVAGKPRVVPSELGRDEIARKEDKTIGARETSGNKTADSSPDEQQYEDDFEDYESDFESDTSVVDTSAAPIIAVNRSTSDGVTYAAAAVCVEEKLEPFLDESFEVGSSLERTVEMGLKNFQTAGKRKREQDAKEKVQTRGNVLMGMIKLDTVSYTLLDLPSIPYEQYIKLYGRSNTAQVQTQTHDDNADKEVQTNDVESTDKWTQRPIVLTDGLDCSSPEYLCAKLGAGGTVAAPAVGQCGRRTARVAPADPDRLCAVGRTMLAVLERRAVDRAEHRPVADGGRHADFSDGFLSPAVSAIAFLAERPVTSVRFARIDDARYSPAESLVTTHQVMDAHHQHVVCVWNVSNMDSPLYALKCPNRVTAICTVPKSTGGFVAAAHADGSICVWDLRESRLHQQQYDRLACPLRSPSFNTALSGDRGRHMSKIVGLSAVTYCNAGDANDESPDEICSLDEDFGLAVWTVADGRTAGTGGHENGAGTAPWSSAVLVKTHTAEAHKNVPERLSDGVTPTCMCLNSDQDAFVGTSSGLIFRYNLGENRVRPSYHACRDTGEHFSVNSLDICPFDSNYFLAACSNGEVMVYRSARREPLRRFSSGPPGPRTAPALTARWCAGRPGVVIRLNSFSELHTWDLCGDGDITEPTATVQFPGKTVTSMSTTRIRRNAYVALAFADGAVEMHRMKNNRKTADGEAGTDVADTRRDLLARVLAGL